MDQSISVPQIPVLDKIADSKDKVKLSLRQKFQGIKLETIKDSLKENNISIPDNVSNVKELKKFCRNSWMKYLIHRFYKL